MEDYWRIGSAGQADHYDPGEMTAEDLYGGNVSELTIEEERAIAIEALRGCTRAAADHIRKTSGEFVQPFVSYSPGKVETGGDNPSPPYKGLRLSVGQADHYEWIEERPRERVKALCKALDDMHLPGGPFDKLERIVTRTIDRATPR